MTTPRDFDRMARAWLDLMPDEAPDRLIQHVLQAVDATPQIRRPFGTAIGRLFQMNRQLIAAAAAVLVVAVVGGAFLLNRGNGVGSPTQAPSPTATQPAVSSPEPTLAAGTDLPAALVAGWFGADRAVPKIQAGAGAILFLDAAQMHVAQSNQQPTTLVRATASIVDGRIQLVSQDADTYPGGAVCPKGTTGFYAYTLSSSGNTLTLQRYSDPCSGRSTMLEGTWWKKGCLNGTACYGSLDAGTYGTQYFDPRVGPADPWLPNYGAMSFTVSDGWALAEDFPTRVRFSAAADFAREATGTDPSDMSMLTIVAQPFPKIDGAACNSTTTPKLGDPRSPADILVFIQAQPWIDAGPPQSLTVGGYAATQVDLRVKAGASFGCASDAMPYGEYLAGYGANDWGFGLSGTARARLILVDLGDGDVVAAVIESLDQANFDTYVPQAMPIISSLTFE
jgi:hypothetical protein